MHYLAYGSNLHPVRLLERGIEPRLAGVVEMPGRVLRFHKRSTDGSGKGTLWECDGGKIFGAVYEISPDEKAVLDGIEGLGNGYDEAQVQVTLHGERHEVFTYLASSTHIDTALHPYHWYKSMVLLGCEYHRFPKSYVAAIEAVTSVQDPDTARRRRNEDLIAGMRRT